MVLVGIFVCELDLFSIELQFLECRQCNIFYEIGTTRAQNFKLHCFFYSFLVHNLCYYTIFFLFLFAVYKPSITFEFSFFLCAKEKHIIEFLLLQNKKHEANLNEFFVAFKTWTFANLEQIDFFLKFCIYLFFSLWRLLINLFLSFIFPLIINFFLTLKINFSNNFSCSRRIKIESTAYIEIAV